MNLARLSEQRELLFVGFNQDYGSFACGTTNGFRVFNSDPFKEKFRREFQQGGIGIVEMLFRCNILAIVGGGTNPRYPTNKVMIWDDHQNRCIGEVSFRSEVVAVRLRRDRIVAALRNKVYVYNFKDLKMLDQMDTIDNPLGLLALSPNSTNNVLACLGLQKGHVRVELHDKKKTTLIHAHEGSIVAMSLSMDGMRLATASDRGTLIRVWDTLSGDKLQELRRGTDNALIYSIAFNYNCQYLCCSSDHGTVHVFVLSQSTQPAPNEDDGAAGASGAAGPSAVAAPANTRSSFSFMRTILPKYFSSEWSFAHFRLPSDVQTIVAFGPDQSSIVALCSDGTYFKYTFDQQKGGECKQETQAKFFDRDVPV